MKKGFTLIELLVVIAIIGILAAVILVSLNSARIKSRQARAEADIAALPAALEMYNDANGKYPVGVGFADMATALKNAKFLQNVPSSPDTTLFVYEYCSDTNGTGYYLLAKAQNTTYKDVTLGDTAACTTPAP
ncbi:MAG: prepilin-type N-terminal cleavage/methylation domain-containing protein [Patescibacteria group bacterium]|nr:prepilin-type N-terminal cleavage/methylation domain-containing protein [Patescibacteria group bacterium]